MLSDNIGKSVKNDTRVTIADKVAVRIYIRMFDTGIQGTSCGNLNDKFLGSWFVLLQQLLTEFLKGR